MLLSQFPSYVPQSPSLPVSQPSAAPHTRKPVLILICPNMSFLTASLRLVFKSDAMLHDTDNGMSQQTMSQQDLCTNAAYYSTASSPYYSPPLSSSSGSSLFQTQTSGPTALPNMASFYSRDNSPFLSLHPGKPIQANSGVPSRDGLALLAILLNGYPIISLSGMIIGC